MEARSHEIVRNGLGMCGVDTGIAGISAGAVRLIERYVCELLRTSRTMHIVGTTDVDLTIAVQLADSIDMLLFTESCIGSHWGKRSARAAAERSPRRYRVADIGSGAGFPGLVWRIARPHLSLTLFERRERMATFLEIIGAKLGLDGLVVAHEDARGFEPPGAFDVVVSKAAGSLGIIVPVAARLLSIGGCYCTIKGSHAWRRELGESGADRLALEREEPARSGHGRLLYFTKGGHAAQRP